MSRSQFFCLFSCLNAIIPLTSTLANEYPCSIMRPVRRMIQCEGIVSLAMPCSY